MRVEGGAQPIECGDVLGGSVRTPLYQYVVGVDKAKEQWASDEELEKMCQLLIEAMDAGGCGWSSQILGDIGNMKRDFDGTPMVTDQMTEREVVAFSRALRKLGYGTTQITGPLETAAIIARESGRPIIWNALGVSGSVNQHGEMEYPHREAIERLRELNEEEGLRVWAQASTVRFRSEINLEEYGKRVSARPRRRSPSSPIPGDGRV